MLRSLAYFNVATTRYDWSWFGVAHVTEILGEDVPSGLSLSDNRIEDTDADDTLDSSGGAFSAQPTADNSGPCTSITVVRRADRHFQCCQLLSRWSTPDSHRRCFGRSYCYCSWRRSSQVRQRQRPQPRLGAKKPPSRPSQHCRTNHALCSPTVKSE